MRRIIRFASGLLAVLPAILSVGCGGKGEDGAAGMTIASGISCSKLDSGSGTTLGLKYESVVYSTGDRFVTCEVDGVGAGYSSSQIYKSGKNGATTGYCAPTADLDASTGGFWAFTSQGGTNSVAYYDPGSAHHGYTYVFSSGDCTAF
jgi:hypothetical protein